MGGFDMRQFAVILIAVAMCAFTSSDLFAQSNLDLRGIGVKIGMVDPEDVDAAFAFGFVADLGTITPHISLEPHVNIWSVKNDITNGGEVLVRDIVLGAKGKYIFSTSRPAVKPFAGAGLGFHILRSGVDIPAIYYGGSMITPAVSESDTEIKIGLDIGGGILGDINQNWAIQGETWYSIVSDISQLSLQVALLYKLGG
jgi:hypothetical protein